MTHCARLFPHRSRRPRAYREDRAAEDTPWPGATNPGICVACGTMLAAARALLLRTDNISSQANSPCGRSVQHQLCNLGSCFLPAVWRTDPGRTDGKAAIWSFIVLICERALQKTFSATYPQHNAIRKFNTASIAFLLVFTVCGQTISLTLPSETPAPIRPDRFQNSSFRVPEGFFRAAMRQYGRNFHGQRRGR